MKITRVGGIILSGKKNLFLGMAAGVFLVIAFFATLIATDYAHLGRAFQLTFLIKSENVKPVDTLQLVDGAMKGMVEALKDPYAVYLEPKDFQSLEANVKGAYGGVGLYVGMSDDKKLTVMSPIKGTPAFKAGIKAGDIIAKIDGKATQGIDVDKAVSWMKGEAGTKVNVQIERNKEPKLLSFDLMREVISIPSVEGRILEENPEIAYMAISMFSEHTGKDLETAWNELKLKKPKALVLDLRNNPGGSLQAAVDVGGFFVPKGKPVVWLVEKHQEQAFPSSGNVIGLPLVLLINKGSASASEIVAGAIKDTKAGTIVGETSYGKGVVQSVFDLSGGSALKITTAQYLTPNKKDINKKGIVPDIVVKIPEKAKGQVVITDPKKDIQLQKAIEVLVGKIK
jgi:carboxyl-terminal processing protease